jgi:hypothetical protein
MGTTHCDIKIIVQDSGRYHEMQWDVEMMEAPLACVGRIQISSQQRKPQVEAGSRLSGHCIHVGAR